MDPQQEYERRLTARRDAVAALARRNALVANLRLAVFLVGLTTVALAVWVEAFPGWGIAVAAVGYLALVVIHDAVIKAENRATLAVRFYERGLARLDGTWPGTGVPGDDLMQADHPFAADLDLFGHGSLFELVCAARTRAGEERLAHWFQSPAGVQEVQSRQAAVSDLRDRLDLREDLALLGGDVRADLQPEVLVTWGEAPPVLTSRGWLLAARVLAWVLTVAAVASGVAWAVSDLGPIPLVVVALLEGILLWTMRRRLAPVVEAVQQPKEELAVLAQLLGRLQGEAFTDSRLRDLHAELGDRRQGAAAQIHRLERLVTWLDAMRNQLFLPFAFLLLWPLHFSFAIESWRGKWGPKIGRWLHTLGELEALCSLGSLAFEHPEDPFPELEEEGPLFAGNEIRHPLLPGGSCVANSVRLDRELQVLVISGSNMSGKSTLLRTVGVNTVLALAGAPVRAASLKISPLQIGATVRIIDSLATGRSRFFAEIERLKQITELTGEELPVLFLLDEILHGTNSHDRRIGAEAMVRSLIDAGAIGLVTTHDLALADTAEAIAPRAQNLHFRDELVAGKLTFDYRLREGVVQTSNALELMRSVGLAIGSPPASDP